MTQAYRNHDFFRTDNETAMAIRTNCAKHALDDVMQWLEMGGGEVAVTLKVNMFHLPKIIEMNYLRRFSMQQTRHMSGGR